MPPTYYRGCWHVVSRGFLVKYRQYLNSYSQICSSLTTEFYEPKPFFTHAALLHQTFVHCGRFPTAASRRSLGRVSVPMWPITLSGRLRIIAMVSLFWAGFPRVTHQFATHSNVNHDASTNQYQSSFDLHVLGTPPAFVLSQDQTLKLMMSSKKLI